MSTKISQFISMPDESEVFETCWYKNGNMARCTTFSKKRYFFNQDGSIKEVIQLGEDEFKDILKEEGIDPDKPYGPWMIMPRHYV